MADVRNGVRKFILTYEKQVHRIIEFLINWILTWIEYINEFEFLWIFHFVSGRPRSDGTHAKKIESIGVSKHTLCNIEPFEDN